MDKMIFRHSWSSITSPGVAEVKNTRLQLHRCISYMFSHCVALLVFCTFLTLASVAKYVPPRSCANTLRYELFATFCT